jgi:hypothetical protein
MSTDDGGVYPGRTNVVPMRPDKFVFIEPSVGSIQDAIYGLEQYLAHFGTGNDVVLRLAEQLIYLQVKIQSAAITLPESLEHRLSHLRGVVKEYTARCPPAHDD